MRPYALTGIIFALFLTGSAGAVTTEGSLAPVALTPQQMLRNASLCAMRQHELLIAYHLYASKPKEPVFINAMTKARQAVSACINDTTTGLSLFDLDQHAKELRDQFERFNASLGQNTDSIARQGHTGSDPLLEMVGRSQYLVTQLVKASKEIQSAGKIKPVTEVEQARGLALVMRYANVLYVERATFAFGVTLYRQSNSEPTTDILLGRFARGLEALGSSPRLPPDLKKRWITPTPNSALSRK